MSIAGCKSEAGAVWETEGDSDRDDDDDDDDDDSDPSGPPVTTASTTASESSSGGPEPDRATEVCQRWTEDRMNLNEGTWSGSIAACDPGDVEAEVREFTLRLVNLYRFLADLPPVTDDPTWNAKTQECALMMSANGMLSHTPPPSWACYTDDGAEAAGSSNICSGPSVLCIDLYMTDQGSEDSLGHRRWILSNQLGPVGIGSTATMGSCLWVIGGSGTATNLYTAWPPPGPVPFDIFVAGGSLDQAGWSIQSATIPLEGATVEVSEDGNPLPVNLFDLGLGIEGSARRIVPDGWGAERGHTYRVTVPGTEIDYEVEVIDCES